MENKINIERIYVDFILKLLPKKFNNIKIFINLYYDNEEENLKLYTINTKSKIKNFENGLSKLTKKLKTKN